MGSDMDIDVKNILCKALRKSQNLEILSKEELDEKVHTLEAHVFHLRNILKSQQQTSSGTAAFTRKRPFDFKKYSRRHVLLHVSYAGWDYLGYVVQEHTMKTIEAELFRALEITCLIENREISNYHRCGRTDKGVISFGQVWSFFCVNSYHFPYPYVERLKDFYYTFNHFKFLFCRLFQLILEAT